MKKRLILMLALVAMACLLALSVSASPEKPDLGVSFGEVQTISGFTPPSQKYVGTTERVLLFDGQEYVTYPTYYITSDTTTFEMTFSAINTATGKGYDKTSVVMVEAPTGITHFKLWTFSGYTNVLYCKVPGSVVSYGNSNGWSGAFAECSSIRMIEFADGEAPLDSTMFGSQMFTNSKALEYVKLPNNLKSAGGQMFEKCSSLKTVIFGASFETLAASVVNFNGTSNANISHKELYISTTFGGEGITLNNGMFTYNSNATKDEGTKMIFYYTGTKAQAESLQAKALTTTNNGKLAYATIVSIDDFVRAEADATKNYIVYGYSSCEAFYGGHTEGVQLNSCQIGCGRGCGQVELLPNPEHNLVTNTEFGENGYFSPSRVTVVCSVCSTMTNSGDFGPLFVCKGISAKDFGNGAGLIQGYEVDKTAIAAYKALVPDFDFGVLACANAGGGEIAPKPTDKNVVDITFDNMANNFIEIKVVGIPEENVDTPVVFCIYVEIGGTFYYLDNGSTKTSVTGVSYGSMK